VLYTGLKDPQNARRLIRALELADAGITSPPQSWLQSPLSAVPLAGLRWDNGVLHSRIEMRVRQMYDAGIRAEVRQLRRQYPVWSETARQAIGYAEAWDCEEGRCSEAEAVMRTIQRTRQLAKRQRTWFAHQVGVCWLDVDAQWTVAQMAQEILKIWEKYGPVEIRI
jgi:tRNA dimethylallyltransferase